MCLVWHYDVVGIYVKFGGEQLSVGVGVVLAIATILIDVCLLYTSDAADD